MDVDSSLRSSWPVLVRVTAVVLTWRDVADTLACVDTLLESDRISRIIVVDNESTGALSDHMACPRRERVTLRQEARNLGFSAGVNIGLRMAAHQTRELLLIINNDARILDSDLALLCETLTSNQNLSMVAPRIIDESGREEASWGSMTAALGIDHSINPEMADYFTWACVLVRGSIFEDLGYLDESFFMYWEDVDFGLRMRRHGLVCEYVPRATATHSRSSSHVTAGSAIQKYSTHGLMVLARKESRIVAGIGRALMRGAKYLVRGKPRHALACLEGLWLALARPDARGCELFP